MHLPMGFNLRLVEPMEQIFLNRRRGTPQIDQPLSVLEEASTGATLERTSASKDDFVLAH